MAHDGLLEVPPQPGERKVFVQPRLILSVARVEGMSVRISGVGNYTFASDAAADEFFNRVVDAMNGTK